MADYHHSKAHTRRPFLMHFSVKNSTKVKKKQDQANLRQMASTATIAINAKTILRRAHFFQIRYTKWPRSYQEWTLAYYRAGMFPNPEVNFYP
jgi:hypothetical protein